MFGISNFLFFSIFSRPSKVAYPFPPNTFRGRLSKSTSSARSLACHVEEKKDRKEDVMGSRKDMLYFMNCFRCRLYFGEGGSESRSCGGTQTCFFPGEWGRRSKDDGFQQLIFVEKYSRIVKLELRAATSFTRHLAENSLNTLVAKIRVQRCFFQKIKKSFKKRSVCWFQ